MKLTLSTDLGTTDLVGVAVVTAVPTDPLTSVEFFVNDVSVATDTSSPYTYSWDTTLVPPGGHQLRARGLYPRHKVAEVKLNVTVAEQATLPEPILEAPLEIMEIEE